MLDDEAFLEGTDANKLLVELALGREIITGTPRCVIKGPKTRIGGHLGTCAGVSMIGLRTTHPCPVARVTDFMTAFRNVNENWLLAMQAKCKSAVSRLGPARRGVNGDIFVESHLGTIVSPRCRAHSY